MPRPTILASAEPVAPELNLPDPLAEAMLPGRTDPGRLRLVAGRVIPGTRYRIVRWIGEGGMGVVYEVENIDIEKRFALKVLRFDLSQQPHIANIFRDEARAASRIGSPYIVDINHFGELSDGRLYFCMEMLEGHDLTPDPSGPTMGVSEFLGFFRQICKGLGAAHNAGIVHRDIKPENIFSYTQEGRERIKLLDFGISAMRGGRDASGGTPHYMAPEQILSLEFDGRLDIYALGCTACELLTGHTPFDDEDIDRLFSLHLESPPPSFLELNPEIEIPAAVEAVVMRCLSKRPEDRYQDMTQLEVALCEAQIEAGLTTPWDDLPLPELPPEQAADLKARMPSAHRHYGRRRWLWPTVAMLSTGVAAALAFALSERPATDQEREQIDALVARAQNAGALTWYVYPPENDPSAETSYLAVLELEKLEGPLGSLGKESAAKLRHQFADTLTQVGDRYWEVPGARMFARDFYTQAVFFEPDSPVASTRSGITPGQLTELRKNAAKRTFSKSMLASFQLVNDMADPDVKRRAKKLEQRRLIPTTAVSQGLLADAISVSNKVRALPRAPQLSKHPTVLTPKQLADIQTRNLIKRNRGATKAVPTKVAAAQPPAPEPKLAREPTPRPIQPSGPKAGRRRRKGVKEEPPAQEQMAAPVAKRDLKKSQNFLQRAVADRRRGRRSSAERLFNLALAHNSRNHRALHGLSELYFDMGRYEQSVRNAQSAVRLASKNATYRLQYGDALYKVHRYLEARKAYETAKALGARGASQRLRNVEAKIGAD